MKNLKIKDKLIEEKNKLFSEKKLRHTIICGIPCNHEHEVMAQIIEEVSKEDDESHLQRSESQIKGKEGSYLANYQDKSGIVSSSVDFSSTV